MKIVSRQEWTTRAKSHRDLVSPMADAFLHRRGLRQTHPVYDFLFTYYSFSPSKLKQWIPSFEEALEITPEDLPYFSKAVFESENSILWLKPRHLPREDLIFIEKLCQNISDRTPRFGCFGLHEWAMVYRQSHDEVRHTTYPLRLSMEDLAHFVESQKLCCTHYDAFRFFTPSAIPLNIFKPTLEDRLQNEQSGCLHANMDLYKWATKLWPWVGSDFIAKTFLLAHEGRELDMRASPYDFEKLGFPPIRIETEEGRKEYQQLQQTYTQKAFGLRKELAEFCGRLHDFLK